MEAVGVIGSLVNWAKQAYSSITGAVSDLPGALAALWHYITSVHNVVSWLFGIPLLNWAEGLLRHLGLEHRAVQVISEALHRIPGWVWLAMIAPTRDFLQHEIVANWTRTLVMLAALRALVFTLYVEARAYTRQLVAIERVQRTEADHAEHAAMIQAVTAALATVQRQAATGYNSGLHDRLGVIGKLADDLVIDNPAVKTAIKDLVVAVFDLETIDNPVVRFVITKALQELVGKLGVDTVVGDLIARLLATVTGQPKARGLQDVTRDVSNRLNALETQWAEFMANGGADVEQAGREWHDLGNLTVAVGIVDMFALAVVDPAAWATGVADTIGVVGNDTLGAVFSLISKA